MKRQLMIAWGFCLLATAGCDPQAHDRDAVMAERERQLAEQPPPVPTGTEVQAQRPPRVETTVIDAVGKPIGSLSIEPHEQAARVVLHVEGLQPGVHAVHFHERGRCDPPEFESAGAHFDPGGSDHGMPDADSDLSDPDHHAGDMLNQEADNLGMIDSIIINRSVNLSGPNSLLDDDGSALIIHADRDDYESQPAGDSGARIACAPILNLMGVPVDVQPN